MYTHLAWILRLQRSSPASVVTRQCCNLHAVQCNRNELFQKIHAILDAPTLRFNQVQLNCALHTETSMPHAYVHDHCAN